MEGGSAMKDKSRAGKLSLSKETLKELDRKKLIDVRGVGAEWGAPNDGILILESAYEHGC
jgi:hypothetical protein